MRIIIAFLLMLPLNLFADEEVKVTVNIPLDKSFSVWYDIEIVNVEFRVYNNGEGYRSEITRLRKWRYGEQREIVFRPWYHKYELMFEVNPIGEK